MFSLLLLLLRNSFVIVLKDDVDDIVSECVEDFCMILGSYLFILDRFYVWERKLYDEVKVFL